LNGVGLPGGIYTLRRLGLVGVLLALAGCAAYVKPPPQPQAPTRAFLLDHGRHATLVLPRGGDLARYAYGDWDWYVEGRTGAGPAFRALFVPSDAALGRRLLSGPAELDTILAQLRVEVRRAYVIPVDRRRVDALTTRLDAEFSEAGPAVYNAAFDLDFVPYPKPYGLGHNSNHMVAEWLHELGCQVEGPGTMGDWRVEGVEPIEPCCWRPASAPE
jgi:hypothetical protein